MVVGEFADAVDLLVLGGGPGGYAAAIRAAQLGREVTLVERAGPTGLGGVCLHVGCIPSKALIELADAAQRTRDLHEAGLSADGVSVSLERFQTWRGELCAGLARGVGELLAGGGVRVVHGEARFNRADRVAVHIPEDRVVFFEFENAILATGSRPVALPGLPFDGDRVLDSTGALALSAVPASVAVVGAGYIGLELGTALAKLGARVTVVEALDRVLPTVEESLTAPVLRRLRALGVDLRLRSTAQRLDGGALVVEGPDGEDRVEAERVVVAVGRHPNTDELGLGQAGVPVGADGLIEVGADMRATERIAAVGDVVAGPALAHKATAEAAVAAEALSGRPAAFDARAIPVVIFTDPEIGSVGLSEAEARDAGLDAVAATFPLAASGRAGTLGARDGFTRIVADAATDRVVGVHVVGPHASELIAGGALAIELMAAPGDVAATIHPHPTLSEGLREAAELMLGHPLHVAGARRTAPGGA
ncbi:MAG TPA: dihydrolipoyl dehydrogenase [Solirubrobacteraceae bacterium]|nr:dihydrolipoyl dehydrogenase [Solirubrobacteraceae bacterium]